MSRFIGSLVEIVSETALKSNMAATTGKNWRKDNYAGRYLYAHRDINTEGIVRSKIEQEANYFAANILMPEKLIREKVDDLKNEIWGKLPNFVLIHEIADHFVVSESAAEVRLKQLGII